MTSEAVHEDNLGFHIGIFCGLLILTALTVASSFMSWGVWNTVVVLTIAFIKTTLVLLFFMHLTESSGFIKLLTFGAFLWVGVMFGMTLNDFASRHFVTQRVEPNTWITRSEHQYQTPASETHAVANQEN